MQTNPAISSTSTSHQLRIWFVELTIALMVLLFLSTALTKLSDAAGFARAMERSLLIAGFNKFLSITVPAVELLTVTLLIIPNMRYRGLKLSSLLMTAFTIYTGLVLFLYPTDLPCTCGGILRQLSWRQHFGLNIALLLASTIATRLYPQHFVRNKQEPPNTCEHSRHQLTN